MKTLSPSLKKIIRQAIAGQTRSISAGRNVNYASGRNCPIVVIEGDKAPELLGQPYLKTQFRNGSFSKTLYTPSTLRIEVGEKWVKRTLSEAWNKKQAEKIERIYTLLEPEK